MRGRATLGGGIHPGRLRRRSAIQSVDLGGLAASWEADDPGLLTPGVSVSLCPAHLHPGTDDLGQATEALRPPHSATTWGDAYYGWLTDCAGKILQSATAAAYVNGGAPFTLIAAMRAVTANDGAYWSFGVPASDDNYFICESFGVLRLRAKAGGNEVSVASSSYDQRQNEIVGVVFDGSHATVFNRRASGVSVVLATTDFAPGELAATCFTVGGYTGTSPRYKDAKYGGLWLYREAFSEEQFAAQSAWVAQRWPLS